MFLAIKPAFNKLVAAFAAPSKAGATARDWGSHGSPVTFAHLLALAVPREAEQLLELLLRSTAGSAGAWAALFRQELQLHAGLQSGSVGRVRWLRYRADAGYRLLWRQHCGTAGLKPASLRCLISAFIWDEDAGEAWFLLPSEPAGAAPAGGFVTLCVLSQAGLEAVGVPLPLAKLEAAEVAAPLLRPWRALPWLQDRQLELQLVEAAVARGGERGSSIGWQSAVCSSAELVVVDLLAPGAVPADAKVEVAVAGSALVVTVKEAKAGRGGGAGGWWCTAAGTFSVALPDGVVQGPAAARMSRPLGLLSCRIRRAAAE